MRVSCRIKGINEYQLSFILYNKYVTELHQNSSSPQFLRSFVSLPLSLSLELELTISPARDLKNVNWRYGETKPYVVAWMEPDSKFMTGVDEDGDTSPVWDEKLTLPIRSGRVEDAALWIDVVHANASEKTKPLIGSARFPLAEVVDEVGFGESYCKTIKLKRPSGRPQGKVEIEAKVREFRYPERDPYPQLYGQTPRDFHPAPAAYPYAPAPVPYAPAPYPGYREAYGSGYGSGYGSEPQYYKGYDSGNYANNTPAPADKGSKFGVGTGLAVGAVAGVLGGLALAGGADYLEDKIEDKVAEKVEDDFNGGNYDDDD